MNKLMLINALLFFLFFSTVSFSQKGQMLSKEDNDPRAKRILEKMKKEFDSYGSVEIVFDLELELPNQPKETQKGRVLQDGNKFVVLLADQEIYCDGKSVWLYLKSNNEVQINSFDPNDKDGFMTPRDMLYLYEKGEFAYAVVGESKPKPGVVGTDIEFKPLDTKSEYSKFRLSVDEKSNKMLSLKVFSKDGSRYTLQLHEVLPNKKFTASQFVFDSGKHKGIYIEDLRID
jgi:outer membrane lipoprotein carrier protein